MTAPEFDRDVACKSDNSGGSKSPRFEFHSECDGRNTRIDYKLVDHRAGHSVKSSVVLEGRITRDDILDLAENLDFGDIIDPYRAGFPDLSERMPSSWKDSGGAVHVVQRISYTNNPAPDYLPSTDQFLAAVIDYGAREH
jgi:hypothetical protein